jgi:hypothetical protein
MATTDRQVLTATQILQRAWDSGLAQGPAQKGGLFDEAVEAMWVKQWLFYANSTRFASAMGGADYGVFAHGRWYMAETIRGMLDWVTLRERLK